MATGAKRADHARWAIAGAAGAAAALGIVSVFRVPQPGLAEARPAIREVRVQRVAAESATLGAASALRDLTPLFLPTDRNARPARLAPRAVEPSFYQAPAARERAVAAWHFDRLPPAVALKDSRIPPDAGSDPALLRDFLDDAAIEGLAGGIGRDPVPVAEVASRGGFVEVVAVADGRSVLSETLDARVRPPTDKVWQPFVLLANIGATGLMTRPTLETRSGIREVDDFFQNYLARTFRIGERLPPGFYRITVAP